MGYSRAVGWTLAQLNHVQLQLRAESLVGSIIYFTLLVAHLSPRGAEVHYINSNMWPFYKVTLSCVSVRSATSCVGFRRRLIWCWHLYQSALFGQHSALYRQISSNIVHNSIVRLAVLFVAFSFRVFMLCRQHRVHFVVVFRVWWSTPSPSSCW